MKVDVLPLLTVTSEFGPQIVCEFEEWKRFAQLLVGKPMHAFQIAHDFSLIGSLSLYKKKNLNIIILVAWFY